VKIAVYHNLPSGGGKRALYEMTRRLAVCHTIDVYTLSCAEHDFCDLRPFARRHVITPFTPLPLARRPLGRINQGLRALTLIRVHRLQQHIARQIDAAGYDAVFTHNCQFIQSPSVLTFLRTPSVYYCGEPPRVIYEPRIARPYNHLTRQQRAVNLIDPFPCLYRAVLARLDRRNVRAATSILTNSAYTRENLYRVYGIFAHIGYLGVDIEFFRPLALPRESFIVSVGTLNPQKGFDFLIRSLALLEKARRPLLMIICNSADERERAYLSALAQQLQVTVEFRSLIPDQELVRLYNQARLTVYAPIMEPFGFVPLESMACQTPVVGVREGGIRESVTDGVTGLLVDREPEAMAEAIRSLLANPDKADRLGHNGRSGVEERWTWATSIKAIEDYLADVAQPKNRAPST
jgi:glycosyltransferase involved in cell wall biosynthesis